MQVFRGGGAAVHGLLLLLLLLQLPCAANAHFGSIWWKETTLPGQSRWGACSIVHASNVDYPLR